jgi:ferredoxin
MNTTLYVFTGTGNSLAAAECLAKYLGDTVIESIPIRMKKFGPVLPETQRVGFIFPVNYRGVPPLVSEFIPLISLSHVPYIFAVATSGGIGRYAIHHLDNLLKKNGSSLHAGWLVPMVDNYIPYGGAPDEVKQKDILREADGKIREIAKLIESGRVEKPGFPLLSMVLHHLLYPRFIRSLPDIDKRFHVDESCNTCGTCSRVCPTDNIRIEHDIPVWQHHCVFCLACINLCPKEAIQLENKCRGRRRYHHPDISLKRLIQVQNVVKEVSDSEIT